MTAPGVLVFEPEYLGHQPAYVRAIADWFEASGSSVKVRLALNRRLVSRLNDEDGVDLRAFRSLQIRPLSDRELDRCTTGSIPRRAMARWLIFRQLMDETRSAHGHSLFLDPLQLPLALGMRLGEGRTMSGILFRPTVHLAPTNGGSRPAQERMRRALKSAACRRMLLNPDLRRVFSLDPLFPAYARSHLTRGSIVEPLPDPIVDGTDGDSIADPGEDVVAAAQTDRAILLLFGALSQRKGVLALLSALALLPQAVVARIRVVLAGRLDSDCDARVRDALRRLAELPPEDRPIHVVNRFLSTGELRWLVDASDVVLAPYQRHIGSSGALVWSAHRRKPVLAQDYGLIGALVRQFRLGLAVDTCDPRALAAAIERLAEPHERASIAAGARWDDYLAGRTAEEFARRLCRGLLESVDVG